MQPKYISHELFHFVGRAAPLHHEHNFSVLTKVLSTRCISHPPHEVGWGKISYALDLEKRLALEELLVPTVTCYCDIPYEQLPPHISKYGMFGLSISRHTLTKLGTRPVTYVPCRPDDWRGVFTGHTLLRELEATFRGIYEQRRTIESPEIAATRSLGLGTPAKDIPEALAKAEHTLALRVLAFVKPYESTLEDSDPRYYYSEREWRKLGNLVFEPDDVLRVVVAESFVERARSQFPEFAGRVVAAPE